MGAFGKALFGGNDAALSTAENRGLDAQEGPACRLP